MADEDHGQGDDTAERLVGIATGAPFGPGFFLTQLRAFARERCPAPEERLPVVEIHLVSGETLDLCHVIGLALPFAALAVRDEKGAMRTELVPYGLIARITLRPGGAGGPHVGFDVRHEPTLLLAGPSTPEEALRSAASEPGSAAAHAHDRGCGH